MKLTSIRSLVDIRKEFVERWAYNQNDPYSAALYAYRGDEDKAEVAAREWPQNHKVRCMLEEFMVDKDPMDFLPTKPDIAKAVSDRMYHCKDNAEYVMLSKVYIDLRNYIEKNPIEVVAQETPKVMVVPSSETEEEWRETLKKQQAALVKRA